MIYRGNFDYFLDSALGLNDFAFCADFKIGHIAAGQVYF